MPAFICAMIVSALCKLCYCRCYPLLFLLLLILLLIPLSYRYLHHLLRRNKRDRLETLTQCGERPHFAFQHFFGNLTLGHKVWAHRNFNAPPLSVTDMAPSDCSYSKVKFTFPCVITFERHNHIDDAHPRLMCGLRIILSWVAIRITKCTNHVQRAY